MNATLEHQVSDEARRLGFSMRRREGGGYILTDRSGHGIVRATPATLDEAQAFLEQERSAA